MAFPSDSRKADDVDFLKPYILEDFGNGQVHDIRKVDSGFLFRIDPRLGGKAVILVQSAIMPDWDYAFHNADYLLACQPECKEYNPAFRMGQRLRFRLVANPTKRLSRNSRESDGKPVKETSIGKRVPVPTDRLLDWLARHAERSGFTLDKDSTTYRQGYFYFEKRKEFRKSTQDELKDEKSRLRSVRYEGLLDVADPIRFKETIVSGIGSGKAFGFGLLSVAPIHASGSLEAT
jgi:CRISPR system Cascade subunit CasE